MVLAMVRFHWRAPNNLIQVNMIHDAGICKRSSIEEKARAILLSAGFDVCGTSLFTIDDKSHGAIRIPLNEREYANLLNTIPKKGLWHMVMNDLSFKVRNIDGKIIRGAFSLDKENDIRIMFGRYIPCVTPVGTITI